MRRTVAPTPAITRSKAARGVSVVTCGLAIRAMRIVGVPSIMSLPVFDESSMPLALPSRTLFEGYSRKFDVPL